MVFSGITLLQGDATIDQQGMYAIDGEYTITISASMAEEDAVIGIMGVSSINGYVTVDTDGVGIATADSPGQVLDVTDIFTTQHMTWINYNPDAGIWMYGPSGRY